MLVFRCPSPITAQTFPLRSQATMTRFHPLAAGAEKRMPDEVCHGPLPHPQWIYFMYPFWWNASGKPFQRGRNVEGHWVTFVFLTFMQTGQALSYLLVQ